VVALWVLAGTAAWRSERLAARAGLPGVEVGAAPGLVWADAPSRIAARRLLLDGGFDGLTSAASLLERSVRARPLYAPSWLARAECALRRDRRDRARDYASVSAALWPRRERILWRVAMLLSEIGDQDGAFETLRDYLGVTVSGVGPAVWVAERLEPDPARRAARLLPDRDTGPGEADAYLERLLQVAVSTPSVEFVRPLWGALSAPARADRRRIALYVDALIAAGATEDAIAAWRRHHPSARSAHGVTNPGFEEPLARGGLGWRIVGLLGTRDSDVRHAGGHSRSSRRGRSVERRSARLAGRRAGAGTGSPSSSTSAFPHGFDWSRCASTTSPTPGPCA
jgi:hypothetical protein